MNGVTHEYTLLESYTKMHVIGKKIKEYTYGNRVRMHTTKQ